MVPENPLVQRYEAELDVYKFQVDLGTKIAPAILTIAGSIIAFMITRDGLPRWTWVLSLLVPLLLCAGFCAMYFVATDGAKKLNEAHATTAKSLGLEAFNLKLLVGVCRLGYWLCLLAGIGIAVVMFAVDSIKTTSSTSAPITLTCK
jgi:hypothetical protein